ncbi:3-oxoacyl-ACP synthase [Psychroserpens algicola]|uniref:3-oxoacyl-ACP synthase n=1 Tax=Psychroserpens algicola TaxID=1719034 RepID=UPI0019532484|nr:3-oxoacyl-ACP synthase [Psychroserpens algicola]
MNSSLKHTLFEQCQHFVDGRLNAIQQTISEIQESLSSETKSSAGDKHETGRAMLQLEREKAGQQLAEIQKLNQILSKIDLSKPSKTIGLGSLVFTTQAHYFIIISAGQLLAQDQQFYAISANTPIAKLLLGKQAGDLITFRNQEFTIIEVR